MASSSAAAAPAPGAGGPAPPAPAPAPTAAGTVNEVIAISSDDNVNSLSNENNAGLYAATADPPIPLHVCIVLDITGSMQAQIDGCQAMIGAYCHSNFKNQKHIVKLHIITYTEGNAKSYVSYFTSENSDELESHVYNIQLSVPPECPDVSASGEDGPENCMHGLAQIFEKVQEKGRICLDYLEEVVGDLTF